MQKKQIANKRIVWNEFKASTKDVFSLLKKAINIPTETDKSIPIAKIMNFYLPFLH